MPLFYDPQLHNTGGALSRGIREGMNLALTNYNIQRQQRADERDTERFGMQQKEHEIALKSGQQNLATGGLTQEAAKIELARKQKLQAAEAALGSLSTEYETKLKTAATPQERAKIIGEENTKAVKIYKDNGFIDKANEMTAKHLQSALEISEKWGLEAAALQLEAGPVEHLKGVKLIKKDNGIEIKTADGNAYLIDKNKAAQGLPVSEWFKVLHEKPTKEEKLPTTAEANYIAGRVAAGIAQDVAAEEWAKKESVRKISEAKAGKAASKDDEDLGKKKMTPAAVESYYNNLKKDITDADGAPLPGKEKLYANIAAYRASDLDRISKGFPPVNMSNIANALAGTGKPIEQPTAGATGKPKDGEIRTAADGKKYKWNASSNKWAVEVNPVQKPATAPARPAVPAAQTKPPVVQAPRQPALAPGKNVIEVAPRRPGVAAQMQTRKSADWDWGPLSRVANANIPEGYTPEQWGKLTPLQQAAAIQKANQSKGLGY